MRARKLARYPLEEYAKLFDVARDRQSTGENPLTLSFPERRTAEHLRFELYGFIIALEKSPDLAHKMLADSAKGFKLTLVQLTEDKTGATALQFIAYNKTGLMLDIMAQVAEQTQFATPELSPTHATRLREERQILQDTALNAPLQPNGAKPAGIVGPTDAGFHQQEMLKKLGFLK